MRRLWFVVAVSAWMFAGCAGKARPTVEPTPPLSTFYQCVGRDPGANVDYRIGMEVKVEGSVVEFRQMLPDDTTVMFGYGFREGNRIVATLYAVLTQRYGSTTYVVRPDASLDGRWQGAGDGPANPESCVAVTEPPFVSAPVNAPPSPRVPLPPSDRSL